MKRTLPLALIAIRGDFPITTSRICGAPLSKKPPLPVWLLPLGPKSIVTCTAVNRRLPPVDPAPSLRPLSLRLRHLLPCFVVCPELLRHYLQRGIELHKRVLDGGMIFVARPADVPLGHGLGRFAVWLEKVVR